MLPVVLHPLCWDLALQVDFSVESHPIVIPFFVRPLHTHPTAWIFIREISNDTGYVLPKH